MKSSMVMGRGLCCGRMLVVAAVTVAFAACAAVSSEPGKRELMIVGVDEKVIFDNGAPPGLTFRAPGKDMVSVVDMGTDRLAPRIVANLPLTNSVFGPPTNLAITPDESLAIVANSMEWQQAGAGWKPAPDNKLYVIDLTASPPARIETVTVGKQPSGLSINRAGNLALIANRADNSVSVLRISGKKVQLIDTVPMGEQVTHVAFTPDGQRALVAKFAGHKVALLAVQGEKVTYTKQDIPVGLWPYNLDITPDGKLALVANTGNGGRSDGHVNTVSVIDLEANPPRVIDEVMVGDGPEGFAISPTGKLAVAPLLRGADGPKDAWFHNRNSTVVALKIDGKKVTRTNEVEVRGLPEGIVFSNDGRYVYVGNYIDRDVTILRVDGDRLVDTGKSLQLPGQPASMRARTR